MAYIGLLDCNNFFVSCERLFRPDLLGKPVLVLSANDGCVIARSKEVKDMGIPMGVPYFQIKDTVEKEGIVLFSTNFTLYRDLSARVMRTLARLVPKMEQYSVDEAFFELDEGSIPVLLSQLQEIKLTVEREIGIPVSLGVSDTKTRAKLVNHIAKKTSGTAVLLGADVLARCGMQTLGDVWGVGRQLSKRYAQAGIKTINDYIETPLPRIRALGQTPGERLWNELRGQSCFAVETTGDWPKSMMSTRSFGEKTSHFDTIADALSHHVRHITTDLRRSDLVLSTLTVLLRTSRHGDWFLRGGSESVTVTVPTNDTTVCLKLAHTVLKNMYEVGVPYNKVGAIATGLYPKQFVPTSLFADTSGEHATSGIDSIVDHLNERFGRDTVRQGVFQKTASWQPRREQLSPCYTTQWSAVPTIKAS